MPSIMLNNLTVKDIYEMRTQEGMPVSVSSTGDAVNAERCGADAYWNVPIATFKQMKSANDLLRLPDAHIALMHAMGTVEQTYDAMHDVYDAFDEMRTALHMLLEKYDWLDVAKLEFNLYPSGTERALAHRYTHVMHPVDILAAVLTDHAEHKITYSRLYNLIDLAMDDMGIPTNSEVRDEAVVWLDMWTMKATRRPDVRIGICRTFGGVSELDFEDALDQMDQPQPQKCIDYIRKDTPQMDFGM